uniref:Carbohydrate sulfotransferase n=1 Tax=Crocodylus porosus TaxID=8502 RepID=A0A7M4FL70_CROPO
GLCRCCGVSPDCATHALLLWAVLGEGLVGCSLLATEKSVQIYSLSLPGPTLGCLVSHSYRKVTLNSTCLKNNLFQSRRNLTSYVAYQIFVEHKHKLIYCEVPKVGCTNWKRIIFLLQMNLSRDASEIKHDYIHTSHLLKRLSSYPSDKQEELLNSYTKVMFTRHPLERLVSAYRDKLLPNSPMGTRPSTSTWGTSPSQEPKIVSPSPQTQGAS